MHSQIPYRCCPGLYPGLFGLFMLFVSITVSAQSSVWQISKGDKVLYIGGTIHVLGQDDYPLPEEFDQAFSEAGKLVFETDITEVKSPAFGQKMMQQMLYPAGQSLKDELDKPTYERLADYFSDKIPMSQIDGLKPGMVVLMLSAIEFQRIGMVLAGVDEHFWGLAVNNNKAIGTLETLDEQLAFIVNMGEGRENELIMNTLDDIKRTEAIILSLLTAWRAGDEPEMERLLLQEMIDDYPQLYQNLLVKRNNNWLPSIEAMIQNEEVEFVLVGTLHLIGDDGLLQQLRDKGYKVSQY
ncbi:MAG: TraB/GumN family protein [Bacteroidota bacterium]